LVKDRQSAALIVAEQAKSFGRKLDPTYVAATHRRRKAMSAEFRARRVSPNGI